MAICNISKSLKEIENELHLTSDFTIQTLILFTSSAPSHHLPQQFELTIVSPY